MTNDQIPAIRIQPQAEASPKLESITFPNSLECLLRALYADEDTQLRALAFDNFVCIGVATGAKPYSLHWCGDESCAQHSVVLRGPTLLIPLELNHKLPGTIADFCPATAAINAAESITLTKSILFPNDLGAELQRWQWGEPFPIQRRDRAEVLSGIIARVLEREHTPELDSLGMLSFDKRVGRGQSFRNFQPPAETARFPSYFSLTGTVFLENAKANPDLAALIASVTSFYVAEIEARARRGHIKSKQACELIQQATEVVDFVQKFNNQTPCYVVTPEDFR